MNGQRVIILALVLAAAALTAGSVKATARSEKVDNLALELVGQFQNSPPGVTPSTHIHYGYVSYMRGLSVFGGPAQDETDALFTFFADAGATTRVIPNGPLRIVTRVGSLTIYRDASANGDFANPNTFRDGTPVLVARFRQHVVLNTVTGSFTTFHQNTITSSTRFSVGNKTLQLGEKGATFKTVLSGHGSSTPTPSGYIAGYTFSLGGASEKQHR